VARQLSLSQYLLNDTANINVDSVIIELKIPAVVYSLSRAMNQPVPLMIKLKCIFSFLFYLSLYYASSSRSLPSYIDRAPQQWFVRKRTLFFVALDRVDNDACTNGMTNYSVWGILLYPKGDGGLGTKNVERLDREGSLECVGTLQN
jgi:hypothetical protein